MTRDEYHAAARRVALYGSALAFLTVALVSLPGAPWLDAHGGWWNALGRCLDHYLRNDLLRGLIGGLAIALVVLPPLFVPPLVVFWWVDRRFGPRCPSCGRSLTLRCKYEDVLETGRCGLCQAVLFEPGPAGPLFRPIPPEEMAGNVALGGVIFGLVGAGLVAAFPRVPAVRALAGSLGFMAAAIGSGVAFWCGIRLRTWKCGLAALLAIPCVAAWAWLIRALIRDVGR